MSEPVGFYHLTKDSLAYGAAKLLERVYASGKHALVRAQNLAFIENLDAELWTYEKDSFLPHGTSRNGAPDLQPILLTTDESALNGASVLLLLENVMPDNFEGFDRVLYMFEGRDDASLKKARAHWIALNARSVPLVYWQQTDSGGWKKAAEA